MAALAWIVRGPVLLLGGVCLALGGLGVASLAAPENDAVTGLRDSAVDAALSFGLRVGLPGVADVVDALLSNAVLGAAAAPVGLVLLWLGLRRSAAPPPVDEDDDLHRPESVAPVAKKDQKKALKKARALARAKRPLEAADLCFEHALMEDAARFFIEAGEHVRAAEIRHDQNRFIEAAELYLEAGSPESAGTIFAQQSEWGRAAEAYLTAGNKSVAAEMYEKAENWRLAAECYEESEFLRHAAKAWVRCSQWKRAADCLQRVVTENSAGSAQHDPKLRAETRKLVRMAADLYGRAQDHDRAQRVLEQGECWVPAGEAALRRGAKEEASELFLKGGDAPRAAEVLKELGRDADSLLVLAEHYRDRGQDLEAAEHFEAAGEHVAAGDLFRMLERFDRAASCYEQRGEYAQAAEMYRLSEEPGRAAECYARAGCHAEAAECWALAGDVAREADCLAKAGCLLRAGELYLEHGDEEAAIVALQQIDGESEDFAGACAALGEIFRRRGMNAIARQKLTQAVEGAVLDRDSVGAFHGLAQVLEAEGEVAEALDLYEKILAFDYHFADVEHRVEACREQLKTASSPDAPSSPLGGSQGAGRYKILGKLGRGGMGIVYKAQDTVLDRVVAYKVLPDAFQENPQALKNFLREAKSAAALNHPNIVTVYDAGEQDGVYYIAMEYVDGNTLKEIVKARGRISSGGIIHVLAQMCEGLAYAHDKKIVHRDVKTANTMWTRDRKAKIMDFGLARVIEEVRNHTTVVSGTPYYMSPEQTLGKNVDHRTDLYSLGVTVFELATGVLPFREGNLPYHHVHTAPPDPRELQPELPEVLARIIAKCLQKDPGDRYQSTREILGELKRSLKG